MSVWDDAARSVEGQGPEGPPMGDLAAGPTALLVSFGLAFEQTTRLLKLYFAAGSGANLLLPHRLTGFEAVNGEFRFVLDTLSSMVHAFRRKGTILSIPWDDLYLTLKYNKKTYLKDWNLLGHVMDLDGITIRETIIFPTRENEEAATRLWKYTRRFMEEGPQNLYAISDLCLPIWDRKEPFSIGLARLMALMGFLQLPFFPVLFVFAIGRYIAGLTNKIPVWLKEILETCQIDPNDLYARDWRTNISWWKFRQKPPVQAAKP